jgi:ubiquinone/menaquinone biosynthesis C-methylase UbiE
MENKNNKEYILGVSKYELDRLKFQHSVWKEYTDKFFERLNMKNGWKILDVGAGPGFAAMDLLEKVGDSGEVTILEPAEYYLNYFKEYCLQNKIINTRYISGTVESSELPLDYYNLIFARWVIGFVPDAELFLDKLIRALTPGGIIAFQDYAYEGLAIYPRGGAFEKMPNAIRAYWRLEGGDPYIAARLPKMFKDRGIKLIDFTPISRAGNPDSPVYEWAHRFFKVHIQVMADKGIVTKQLADEMLADWLEHRNNPDSIFFSPIIVDVAGIRS